MINLFYFFNCLECGHFCIKYILKKDGKKASVSYCKKLMSLGLVSKVLKEYYSEVNCYKVNDIYSLNKRKNFLTLIKTRKDNLHYIVVEEIKNDYVYYYDPAFIKVKKSKLNKFKEKWSHYCCFYN